MRIGFTGHRNSWTEESYLEEIYKKYPGAIWVHGGAQGFDAQVDHFARIYEVTIEVIKPDYGAYPSRPKFAPLARNIEIVDRSSILVACYDGRTTGGTYFTICYANQKGKPVIFVKPQKTILTKQSE